MRGAARTIWRIAPLGHNAFEAKFAGMLEYQHAVFFVQVLVEAKVV